MYLSSTPIHRLHRILHTLQPAALTTTLQQQQSTHRTFNTQEQTPSSTSDLFSTPLYSHHLKMTDSVDAFKLPADAPQGTKPIQYYSLATPNGQKIGIMLEELGLEYDAHTVDISKNTQFESWFKAINPNSKIPALVDLHGPDGKPLAVFESGAILVYLAEKSGRFLPRHGHLRYSVLQWLFFQMGGIGPMLGQTNHFYIYAPEQIPYAKKRYLTESMRLLDVVDTQLSKHAYIAGPEYSIADMANYPWIDYFVKNHADKVDGKVWNHINRWREELSDRPAVRKGILITKRQ